jgi:hypothetical protein
MRKKNLARMCGRGYSKKYGADQRRGAGTGEGAGTGASSFSILALSRNLAIWSDCDFWMT